MGMKGMSLTLSEPSSPRYGTGMDRTLGLPPEGMRIKGAQASSVHQREYSTTITQISALVMNFF